MPRYLLDGYEWPGGFDLQSAHSTAMDLGLAYIAYLAALFGSLGFLVRAAKQQAGSSEVGRRPTERRRNPR